MPASTRRKRYESPLLYDSVLSTPAQSTLRHRIRARWVLLAVLATSLLLRVFLASATTYLWDEERTFIPLAEEISLKAESFNLPVRSEFNRVPALPSYLIKLGSLILGKNAIGFRAVGAILGVLTIFVIFRVASEWRGPAAALWAAILLGFNEYHVAVSSLAVEKVFYLFFVSLASLSFVRFLKTENAKYLYITGMITGLAFLSKETAVLIIPVFFLALLLSRFRSWLARKEPYFAILLFLTVIAIDLHFNFSAAAGHESQYYDDQLSRWGGVGFNKHYFLFYGRDAVRIAGRKIFDPAPEYPTMNMLFGLGLFGTILWVTFALGRSVIERGQQDVIRNFLIVFFWFIVGFFILSRPGDTDGKLNPVVWFWVDMTLLPAVLLTGDFLSRIQNKLRVLAYGVMGLAICAAVIGVTFGRLGMPTLALGMNPDFLWPAEGNLVKVDAHFHFCVLCQKPSKANLVDIRIRGGANYATDQPGLQTDDVRDAEINTDDRSFQLRAVQDRPNGLCTPRGYVISYRLVYPSGRSRLVSDTVRVPCPDSIELWRTKVFRPRPWATSRELGA